MTLMEPHQMVDALVVLGWQVHSEDSGVTRLIHPGCMDLILVPMNQTAPEYPAILSVLHQQLGVYRRLGSAASRMQDLLAGMSTGVTPFGTTMLDGVLVPNEREQVALSRMQALRSQGYSLRRIADALLAEGHVPRRAGRWSAEVVRQILKRAAERDTTSRGVARQRRQVDRSRLRTEADLRSG